MTEPNGLRTLYAEARRKGLRLRKVPGAERFHVSFVGYALGERSEVLVGFDGDPFEPLTLEQARELIAEDDG